MNIHFISSAFFEGTFVERFVRKEPHYVDTTDFIEILGSSHGKLYKKEGNVIKIQKLNPDLFHNVEVVSEMFPFTQEVLFPSLSKKTVLLKDQGIGEALVMNSVSSKIIPELHNFFIYFCSEDRLWKTYIEMSFIEGLTYRDYYTKNSLQHHPEQNLELLLHLFLTMRSDFKDTGFVHGDLLMNNVIVKGHPPRLYLIDFGLSSVKISGYRFLPFNTYRRLNAISVTNRTHTHRPRYNQKVDKIKLYDASVDICKLMQYYNKFSGEFEKILDGCMGPHYTRKYAKDTSRGIESVVMLCLSNPRLTYTKAITELEERLQELRNRGGHRRRGTKSRSKKKNEDVCQFKK